MTTRLARAIGKALLISAAVAISLAGFMAITTGSVAFLYPGALLRGVFVMTLLYPALLLIGRSLLRLHEARYTLAISLAVWWAAAVFASYTSIPSLLFGDISPEPSRGPVVMRLAVYTVIAVLIAAAARKDALRDARVDA